MVPDQVRDRDISGFQSTHIFSDAKIPFGPGGFRPIRTALRCPSGPTKRPAKSWNRALDPNCPTDDALDRIETLIIPRARDLGRFEVRRTLRASRRRMVGPFIFFDQMCPAEFLPTRGLDVRPHPHIGLVTISYLYRGRMHRRDSLPLP